jgi:CRISPR/Cas system CSM-associated protein Csm3 (group 7 of RAMP superfamily)
MERFSAKIEIMNHFDNLINRIDIDIESSLEKYNDQQLLSEILKSSEKKRLVFRDIFNTNRFVVKFFDTIESSNQNPDSLLESSSNENNRRAEKSTRKNIRIL